MRELVAQINGTEYTLTANFKASMAVAEQVADPILLTQDVMLQGLANEKGYRMETKHPVTSKMVYQLIKIGVDATSKLNASEINKLQADIFEEGYLSCMQIALDYLGLLVGPGPNEVSDQDAEKSTGK